MRSRARRWAFAVCALACATAAPLPAASTRLGAGSRVPRLTVVGERVCWRAEGAVLWCSDGTPAGTATVDGLADAWSVSVSVAGGRLFGVVRLDPRPGQPSRLRVGDATRLGSEDLLIMPSIGPALALAGGIVFLAGPLGDPDLWSTDGTPGGTRMVVDLPAGYDGPLYPLGDVAVALDTEQQTVWRTDGTAAGTSVVGQVVGAPEAITPAADRVYVLVRLGGERQIVALDADGVRSIATGLAGADGTPMDLVALGPALLYQSFDADGRWTMFGASDGVVRRLVPAPEPPLCFLTSMGTRCSYLPIRAAFTLGTRSFHVVRASDPDVPPAVMATDGTPAGTMQVEQLPLPYFPFQATRTTATVGDTTIYPHDHAEADAIVDLVQTDGTTGGTRVIASLPGDVVDIAPLGGRVVVAIRAEGDGTDIAAVDVPCATGGEDAVARARCEIAVTTATLRCTPAGALVTMPRRTGRAVRRLAEGMTDAPGGRRVARRLDAVLARAAKQLGGRRARARRGRACAALLRERIGHLRRLVAPLAQRTVAP